MAEQQPDSKETLTTGSPAKKHKSDVAASPSFGSGSAMPAEHAGVLRPTRCSMPDTVNNSGCNVVTSTQVLQVLQCAAAPSLEQV